MTSSVDRIGVGGRLCLRSAPQTYAARHVVGPLDGVDEVWTTLSDVALQPVPGLRPCITIVGLIPGETGPAVAPPTALP
jgi:hypothetical protein